MFERDNSQRIKLIIVTLIYREDAEFLELIKAIAAKEGQINALVEEIVKRKPVLSIYLMIDGDNRPSKELLRAVSELGKVKIANSKNVYLNNF